MAVREATEYQWYQIVAGKQFTQGDILPDCPIPIAPPDEAFFKAANEEDAPETAIGVKRHSLIVITQACDIEYDKVESIILCPIWNLEFLAEGKPQFRTSEGREKLRRGHFYYYHLLNRDEDLGLDFQVVDFRELYSLPTDFVRLVAEKSGDRARLLPPYREHLSQSFARYFMRVGLPIDIPKFG